MESAPLSLIDRLKKTVSRRSFWIVGGMLLVLGLIHYLTPQVRSLPVASHPLGRHAIERIIFILPVAGATFAFGQAGGLIALALTILIMLPRAILLSPYPVDASAETVTVGIVGYLVVWMIETQEKEKRLRQEAVLRLRRLSGVAEQITSELELDRILPKVLQIAEELINADGGVIALLDRERNLVRYSYLHNLPQELEGLAVPGDQGLSWEVMTTSRHAVIENYSTYPRAIPAFVEAGVASVVAVPIVSGEHSFGALALVSLHKARSFLEGDVAVLTGIGRQAGIAIENAHLYESMRFYARQITRVQEDERKRIARELHDETIQMLIVISRRLDALAALAGRLPEDGMERLESLQSLLDDTLKGVRRFIQDLRPSTLDHLGLAATLEGLIGDLEKEGIETELLVTGEARRLMPEEELVLFRIAQEALSNVRRHSGASQARVEVEFFPAKVRMIVEDNGRGFSAPRRIGDLVPSGRLGLIGMHERARLLDGTLAIQSEPGKGAVVTVEAPVKPEPKGASDEVQRDGL